MSLCLSFHLWKVGLTIVITWLSAVEDPSYLHICHYEERLWAVTVSSWLFLFLPFFGALKGTVLEIRLKRRSACPHMAPCCLMFHWLASFRGQRLQGMIEAIDNTSCIIITAFAISWYRFVDSLFIPNLYLKQPWDALEKHYYYPNFVKNRANLLCLDSQLGNGLCSNQILLGIKEALLVIMLSRQIRINGYSNKGRLLNLIWCIATVSGRKTWVC